MALNDPGEKKTKQFMILAIIALLAIIIYAVATKGSLGLKAIMKTIMTVSIWLGVILAIVFIVYKIFFEKNEIDLIANDKQSIINAGKLCKPPLIKGLYFTGDREHGEAKMGNIIGYCQIQNYEKGKSGTALPEDCFVFKTQPFPFNLFEEAKVFRCYPHEHSQLIGDVKIYAISPVEKFGYFFPNNAFLNVRRIDESVVKEAYRGQIHETMKDLVSITKKAAGLDAENDKLLQQRKLLKIPTQLEEQESRQ